MLDVLNRKQFTQVWESVMPGLGEPGSALWASEEVYKKSRWFVKVRPIGSVSQGDFYIWCDQNCRGQVICYSSSEDEEWWGFTHRADIAWWVMKWA